MGNTVATTSATSTGGSSPSPLPTYTPNAFYSASGTGHWQPHPSASLLSSSSANASTFFFAAPASSQKNAVTGGALPDDVAALVSEFPTLTLLGCIGTSRLFRAVLTFTPEDGVGVGKLLVRKEPQASAKTYLQKYGPVLDAYRAQLLPDIHPNVCSYDRVLSSDRTVLLLRRFFAHCLSDRLHARPFLSASQQLFLAFQLLLGVAQLHSLGLVHGDIKGANVGITSWLHACLIDAAPWKPLRLSLADGRKLTAFFGGPCTGQCHVAPERFFSAPENSERSACDQASSAFPRSSFSLASVQALQSADVFSMAATLLEIFTDVPGCQQRVVDLPLLLQLRQALLEQREDAAKSASRLEKKKECARTGLVPNPTDSCPVHVDYRNTSREALRPRHPGGSDTPVPRGQPVGDGNCMHGGGTGASDARGEDAKNGRPFGEADRTVSYSLSPFLTDSFSVSETSKGLSTCRLSQTPERRPCGPSGVNTEGVDEYANPRVSSSHSRSASRSLCGTFALPSPSSPVPPLIRSPPALARALRGVRSACIRRALQEGIFLRQPETRLSALDCLERWGAPWSPAAFFPPAFFSCFLPLFTVLTHPTYQQPDIRMLLVWTFLPHFVAATLQRRRRGPIGDTGDTAETQGNPQGWTTWEREGASAEAGDAEREQRVVEMLEEAVEQHVASVDPQVMYQCILHSAVTSPDCSAVAALVGAWGASRRREAAAAVAAAASVFQSLPSSSSSADSSLASPPCSSSRLAFPKNDTRHLLGHPPVDSAPAQPRVEAPTGAIRTSPEAFGDTSGAASLASQFATALPAARPAGTGAEADKGWKEREAAARGAAEAVGGFGEVPHPDLSLDSARRFSARLLLLWRKSGRLAVEKHLPPAEVFRELEADRRALYDGLFLPRSSPGSFESSLSKSTTHAAETRGSGGDAQVPRPGQAQVAEDGDGGFPFRAQTNSVVASPLSTPFPPREARGEAQFISAFCNSRFVSYPSLGSLEAAVSLARPACASPGLRRGSVALLVELVGTTLEHCGSPQVRVCGVSTLAFLARFSTLHSLLNSVLPFLLRALDAPIPAVRAAAVRALPAALSQIYLPEAPWIERDTEDRAVAGRSPSGPAGRLGAERDEQAGKKVAFEKGGLFSERPPARWFDEDPRDTDVEAEGDASDDRAAARSLASGAFDFFVFFSQLLLPRLQRLATSDGELVVRLAVAETLPGVLLATARCLELQAGAQAEAGLLSEAVGCVGVSRNTLGVSGKSCGGASGLRGSATSPASGLLLDGRLHQLRAAVKPLLQQLLTSRQPVQRLALLERVADLASFLGAEEAQQFLLPYLIMQLNDPLAPAIRAAVTLGLGRVGLCGGARETVETCILPCCEQALVDAREEVLLAALRALQLLASGGLLASSFGRGASSGGTSSGLSRAAKPLPDSPSPGGSNRFLGGLLSFLKTRVLPLLVLPSAAVRSEVLHLLGLLETLWGPATSFALLLPLLAPFTTRGDGGGGVEEWRECDGDIGDINPRSAAEVPLLSVEDLPQWLRPPLTHKVYSQLVGPQFRQPLAALGAAVASSERSACTDPLARILFQTHDWGNGAAGRREKESGLSSEHASSGCEDEDFETHAVSRMQRTFAAFVEWQRSRKQPGLVRNRVTDFLAFADNHVKISLYSRKSVLYASTSSPSSPSCSSSSASDSSLVSPGVCRDLSRDQLKCLGILLGLAAADRSALLLLLPYLRSVDRSHASQARLAFFPFLSGQLGSLRGDGGDSSPRFGSAGADPLDEAMPAGQPLGLVDEAAESLEGARDDACPCLHPPKTETAAREYFLMSCLLSPPLPTTVHSLPSLRLSPLQALLPLLPASLVSSSSCEIASLFPVCLVLCLDRHGGRGLSGEKKAGSLRAKPVFCSKGGFASARTGFLRELESAGSAALGAAQLLAVAAAAEAGTRRPLPSLQQAMLGLPATGGDLADLLASDASRLSGPMPFDLFHAAVLGACAASVVRPHSFLADALPSRSTSLSPLEPQPRSTMSPELSSSSASRAFSLPSPLQRDWRCVVLGLPRRPSLEVGRLQKAGAAESGTLNLYSYLTASPPVLLLRHPLHLPVLGASRGSPSRHASSTVSASALPVASPYHLDSPSPPASERASGKLASVGLARLLPLSGPQVSAASTAPGSLLSSQRTTSSLSDASKTQAASSGDSGSSPPLATGGAGELSGAFGSGSVGAGAARRASAPSGPEEPDGEAPGGRAQPGRRPRSGRDAGGPSGASRLPTTGCGVVLCAVPGLAEMARWRPQGQLVGMLLEQDTTGSRQLADTSDAAGRGPRGWKGDSGHRVLLASTEDGRLLVTGCMDTVEGRIAAWSCADIVRHGRATPLSTWSLPSPLTATTLKFLHNTRALAVGGSDGSCRLFRFDSSQGGASSGGGAGVHLLLSLPPPAFPLFSSPSSSLLLRHRAPDFSPLPRRGVSGSRSWAVSASACHSPEARLLSRLLLPASLSFPSFFSLASRRARPPGLLAARAAGAAGVSRGVVGLDHFDSCFEQLLLFLLENGHVGAYDLRASSLPVFSAAALPPWWGLPTAQSVSADGKFLCLGTAGGALLLFDLRLLLPLRAWRVRAEGRLAPVILQLRPCPLHLVRTTQTDPRACKDVAAAGPTASGAAAQRVGLSGPVKALTPPHGDTRLGSSEETPGSFSGSAASGSRARACGTAWSDPGVDGDSNASGPDSTGSCLFLCLVGGDTGAAVAVDLETGRVVATFATSCFARRMEETDACGEEGVSDSEEETVDDVGRLAVSRAFMKDQHRGKTQSDSREFRGRRETGMFLESDDQSGASPRFWLEQLDLSSLITPNASASSASFFSTQTIEAGLAATALSPHCPRCLFLPPALRGPPAFFLTAGNDRCIRYWGLEAASACYLGEADLRRVGWGEAYLGRDRLFSASRRTPFGTDVDVGEKRTARFVSKQKGGIDAYVVVAPEDSCAHRGSAGQGEGLGLSGTTRTVTRIHIPVCFGERCTPRNPAVVAPELPAAREEERLAAAALRVSHLTVEKTVSVPL
ncbi:PIK3R4 kinase-related protein (incomplete catalytic triad) [Toxoplasma gondii VAND]|uniref:PIK3R4 kinase-related protein (Incomplete catalytic triad) n=1 Tax=Toxoplasma gondii VAND TaxID=933077 RepID=A0A086PPX0_TOXGO|nr:PIK3R4 kinase-related protein (incomplete catalytic triad) [Toxoplasma gondii VAND]